MGGLRGDPEAETPGCFVHHPSGTQNPQTAEPIAKGLDLQLRLSDRLLQEFLLLLDHFSSPLLRPFMLIAKQMEDAVDHQEDDHLRSIETETIRLTSGRVHRDDHISQELRVDRNERSFPHGKGKDIGGFVTAQITPIQFLNLTVIDKRDAEFSLREGRFLQDPFSYFP